MSIPMKNSLALNIGVFAIRALELSRLPGIPRFSKSRFIQSAILGSYFAGACLCTIPAGILNDRYGPIPLIRAGLFVTVASGVLICLSCHHRS